MKKEVIVSVHDLAPYYENDLIEIFALLDDLKIQNRTHLVVPNFGRNERLTDEASKSFNALVINEKSKGAEISLHGIHHEYAEFYKMNYEEAKNALEFGLKEFQDVYGFSPPGFVAPQWQMSRDSLRALKDFPFIYTETLRGFRPMHAPIRYAFPLNYDWGIVWMDHFFSAMNRVRIACRFAGLVRFAIHPMDVRNGFMPAIRRHLEVLIRNDWSFITAENFAKSVNHD